MYGYSPLNSSSGFLSCPIITVPTGPNLISPPFGVVRTQGYAGSFGSFVGHPPPLELLDELLDELLHPPFDELLDELLDELPHPLLTVQSALQELPAVPLSAPKSQFSPASTILFPQTGAVGVQAG